MSERPGVNRLLVFAERPAEVAETLGLSVNAVLIAKSAFSGGCGKKARV